MVLSRIAGSLILGACGFVVAAAWIASGHNAVGMGVAGIGGLVVMGALGCLALGAMLLAIAPPGELDGRLIRSGLAILGLGLGVVIPSATARMDEVLIFALLIGGAIAWLGAIVTVIGLLVRRGLARRLGLSVLLGVAGAAVGAGLSSANPGADALDRIGLAIAAVGAAGVLAVLGTIGVTALRRPGAHEFRAERVEP